MSSMTLTIKGVTRSISDWSRQPGAVTRSTIYFRAVTLKWAPKDAVFKRLLSPRVNGIHLKRPAVVLAPNPHLPNPLRPCVGSVRSFSIEHLELLRRVA